MTRSLEHLLLISRKGKEISKKKKRSTPIHFYKHVTTVAGNTKKKEKRTHKKCEWQNK